MRAAFRAQTARSLRYAEVSATGIDSVDGENGRLHPRKRGQSCRIRLDDVTAWAKRLLDAALCVPARHRAARWPGASGDHAHVRGVANIMDLFCSHRACH